LRFPASRLDAYCASELGFLFQIPDALSGMRDPGGVRMDCYRVVTADYWQ